MPLGYSQHKVPSVKKTKSAGTISNLEHSTTRVLHCTIVNRAVMLMFPFLLQSIISNQMRKRRLRGAWFSRLLRHPTRRWSGSNQAPEPTRGSMDTNMSLLMYFPIVKNVSKVLWLYRNIHVSNCNTFIKFWFHLVYKEMTTKMLYLYANMYTCRINSILWGVGFLWPTL